MTHDEQLQKWGGKRAGAGRKPTGRSKTYFSLTIEEKEKLQAYLACIRNKQEPVLQDTIRQKMIQYHHDALKQSCQPPISKPALVLQFYKAQALGELIGEKITAPSFRKEVKPLQEEFMRKQETKMLEKVYDNQKG